MSRAGIKHDDKPKLIKPAKNVIKEPTTNVHLNIGFEDFVTETRALKMRRVAEGRGRLLAIDDSQLKAIVEEDPRKTTGEVAEELNVSQSGVRYLHRSGKSTNLDQWVLHELNESQKKLLRNLLCASLAQQKRAIY
uniref:HTH psq-type domain-containing protein n=1 Tax=Heterorhabditis bacteriophora TaxID=37862 RepID=A0A1I7WZ15_HETBA